MDAWQQIARLREEGTDAVVVTITGVRGSVPGETGAKAIVTASGLLGGNLGGGKVEAKAVTKAQELLTGSDLCVTATWNLQRDVGMTCGGEMSFLFERVVAEDPWHIVVFGAGHVAQALVPLLATLKCRIDVFDTRADWLQRMPVRDNVGLHLLQCMEEGVARLHAKSFLISITQGHSTDRPVLREAILRFPELPFIGVIGSASKRAVLMRELTEDGIDQAHRDAIFCPLGLPIGGNDPAEIAISIAAQLLERRDGEVRLWESL